MLWGFFSFVDVMLYSPNFKNPFFPAFFYALKWQSHTFFWQCYLKFYKIIIWNNNFTLKEKNLHNDIFYSDVCKYHFYILIHSY